MSLGVAIGRTGLAGPRTGTSEPFGRGPVSGGPWADGNYSTNELIGEDCNAIIRLAPVQCNGIDDNVAVMGISLYRLDDSVVSTRRLGILAALQRLCVCVLACAECPVTAPRLGESCVTCGVRECPVWRKPAGGSATLESRDCRSSLK